MSGRENESKIYDQQPHSLSLIGRYIENNGMTTPISSQDTFVGYSKHQIRE
jgi:hypothetical protein